MSCYEIKDTSLFHNKQICLQCKSSTSLKSKRSEQCINCEKKVIKVDKNQFCRKCSFKINEVEKISDRGKDKNSQMPRSTSRIRKVKKDMSKIILDFIAETDITDIPGYEEITITNISQVDLVNHYSLEDLANLISALEYIYNNQKE